MTIFNNPEEVSWRIVDAVSEDPFFGYPAGMYKTNRSSVSFLNMQTGIWEFQLIRESSETDVVAEIGILNIKSGMIESLGDLSFVSGSNDLSVEIIMLLE